MTKKAQLIAGLLLGGLLLTVVGPALAAGGSEGGIPLGAKPVDVAVMSDGRIVVLMERTTDQTRADLEGEGIPDDAASLLLFRAQADGRIWLQSETVLHKEGAVRTEKSPPARGFQVAATPFTAIDPSHMVVTGYRPGDEDRVYVINHRSDQIFNVSGPELRDVCHLNVEIVGDPFMAVADLDTDGINDLVVVTPADRFVRVYQGLGGGEFEVEEELAAFVVGARGDEPRAVDVVNLTRHPDFPALAIVVARGGILSDEITLINSRGDGVFVEGESMSATAMPRGVVAGDFTGSGIPDLVVVGADAFVFLRGLEGRPDCIPQFGTKEPGGPVNIPREYTGRVGIAAADFNFDGNLDLAIANMGDGTVDIWGGRGDGTFDLRQRIEMAPGARPVELVMTDINGNGVLDLVGVNQGTNELVVRMGRGDGTFSTGPDVADRIQFPGRQFGVGQFDCLGREALIRTLFVETDEGPRDAPVFTRTAQGMEIVDRVINYFNEFGVEKLPVTVRGAEMVPDEPCHLDASSASLATRPEPKTVVELWPGLECTDENDEECLMTAEEWLDRIQEQHDEDDERGFVPRALLDDFYPGAIAVGDVIGDGLDETVVVDPLNRDLVVAKWFEAQVRVPIEVLYDYPVSFPWAHPLPAAVVLADVNPGSPGKEIIVLNARSRTALVISVDVDHDAGERDQLVTSVVGHGWIGNDPVVGVALPAGDRGDDMVIVADYASNRLHVLKRNNTALGNASARVLDTTELHFPGLDGPADVAAGEFGEGGTQHIAVAYHGSSRVAVLRRDEQSLDKVAELDTSGRPYSLAVGDFDDDGLLDIAVVSSAGLEVYFGIPTDIEELAFEQCFFRTPDELGGLPLWVGAGDFSGDGKADIVVPVGRLDEYGLAIHGVSYDEELWVEFGPIERECE